MSRVLLINLNDLAPERDHLDTVDRAAGDLFFSSLGLEYGGYIGTEDENCLCAQWMVPEEKIPGVVAHLKANTLDGYDAQLFVRTENEYGCSNEERVF